MLLALDIGNTSIAIGAFEGEYLRRTWRLATTIGRMPDEYASILLPLFNQEGLNTSDITDVCISSVVPPLNSAFEEMFQRYFRVKPLIVGTGIKTGIRVRMDNPREVGPDRVVHAVAAYRLYGGPVIIISMGTATTFDTLTKEGEYIGGAIAPGINISAEALFTHTSMLRRIELVRPNRAIGSNTVTAMQSGIVFGYIGMVEGLISRIQKELPEKAKVVVTGGYSEIIAKETNFIDIVNPNLILIGLRMVYAMNKV
jgi:type III pantothenate kinase